MKKVILIILVLALIVTGVSGFAVNRKLRRSWDISLEKEIQLGDPETMNAEPQSVSVTVHFTLSFYDNNTYRFELNREKMRQELPAIQQTLGSASVELMQDEFIAGIEKLLAEAGMEMDIRGKLESTDISLESLISIVLELTGMTYGDLLKEALSEETVFAMFEELERDGNYRTFAGRMWISDDISESLDLSRYVTFQVDDAVLTIDVGSLEHEKMPLEFHAK